MAVDPLSLWCLSGRRAAVLELADWLRSHGVERAGMESTSDYWKPVFFRLEQQGFDCVLYPASKVKALPDG